MADKTDGEKLDEILKELAEAREWRRSQPDLRFMQERFRQMQDELRDVRRHVAEAAENRAAATRIMVNRFTAMEKRIADAVDELSGIIRIEVEGRLTHAETRIEADIDRRLDAEIAAVKASIEDLMQRLAKVEQRGNG
jgi:hypothetical protein